MAVDYFAQIRIPQSVLVDEVVLKDAWHQAAASAENGEEINRAYTVLRDPAKRIEHLLTLHGYMTLSSEKPGATLFDLFFNVALALERADKINASITEAATALRKAGLMGPLLTSLDELTSINNAIASETALRTTQLGVLSRAFPSLSAEQWQTLAALGHDFAFLTKWQSELQKRQTQMQETLMGKIT